jgi:hypothetical protein
MSSLSQSTNHSKSDAGADILEVGMESMSARLKGKTLG